MMTHELQYCPWVFVFPARTSAVPTCRRVPNARGNGGKGFCPDCQPFNWFSSSGNMPKLGTSADCAGRL